MLELGIIINSIYFIILGFCCGILSGFFGIGGAFILTPALNISGLSMVNSVATGISFTVFSSIIGSYKHFRKGNVILKNGAIVGIVSFGGIILSKSWVIYLDNCHLAGGYIRFTYIFLLLVLAFLSYQKRATKNKKLSLDAQKKLNFTDLRIENRISLWYLLLLGFFVGILQGFLGVGGGFVLVPLYILLGLEAHKAVGTSLFTVVFSSIFGTILYVLSGKVYFQIMILLSLGALFGINYGVNAIKNIEETKLKKFYSLFLLFSLFGILLKQFCLDIAALIYIACTVVVFSSIILYKYYFKF